MIADVLGTELDQKINLTKVVDDLLSNILHITEKNEYDGT